MRLITSALLSLLLGTASIAQDVPVFRMTLPSPLFLTGGEDSTPPDGGENNTLVIETTIPAASRMPPTVAVPVEITGMEATDTIEVDGSGFTWTPGAHGTGTLLWSSPGAGTHGATVRVVDAEGALRDSRAIEILVHDELTASVPQTAYAVEVGQPLTITPTATGLIGSGEGAVQWGSTPSTLPDWLDFEASDGSIEVDTSQARPATNIVLTAVDQADLQDASTESFSVTVNGGCDAWTMRVANQPNTWTSVTYGNEQFVAVAASGVHRVMTSPDGVTWTARMAPADAWRSITYGNGQFVAVGTGTNRVMTSPDGVTWTARAVPDGNNWLSVTFGNDQFVAVASSGTRRVMTSPDGVTWTARTAPVGDWISVTSGQDQFVAVSLSGTNPVMTSPDGINWTARSAPNTVNWSAVTYGNGQFVAVAQSVPNRVMTSPDGVTWTSRVVTESSTWGAITYANGQFVAVASTGTNQVMTSPDGVTWTARAAPEANYWKSITYGNGQFVAVAGSGINRVMTSNCQL
jgi:hypothetical protein